MTDSPNKRAGGVALVNSLMLRFQAIVLQEREEARANPLHRVPPPICYMNLQPQGSEQTLREWRMSAAESSDEARCSFRIRKSDGAPRAHHAAQLQEFDARCFQCFWSQQSSSSILSSTVPRLGPCLSAFSEFFNPNGHQGQASIALQPSPTESNGHKLNPESTTGIPL